MDVNSKALRVSLTISAWEARRLDRKITAEVNAKHAARADAGRYNKHLFGGPVASHTAVCSAAGALRQIHYANTLPWGEDSRILPNANFTAYADAIRKQIDEINRLRDVFVAEYPALVAEAQTRLGSMFNADDYPSVSEVSKKFSVSLGYEPLPSSGDFRLDTLPSDQIAELTTAFEGRVQSAVETAMRDAWQRLYDVTSKIVERLSSPDAVFRDSLIENATELCEVLPRLNVADDPNLAQAVERLASAVRVSPDVLRDNKILRSETADKVSEIMRSMSDVFGATVAA